MSEGPLTEKQVTDKPLVGAYTTLLLRGLLAGLIAGLLAGGVAFGLGEAHIDSAIALEESAAAVAEEEVAEHHHADGGDAAHSHGDALVSRNGQRVGLFLATSLTGIALGAVFATGLHFGRRHVRLSGSMLVLASAAAGWLAIAAVPFGKYPANPPAVGDPATIGERTWLWSATVALGIVAVAVAFAASRRVGPSASLSSRVAAPLLAFVGVVAVGYGVLPAVDEVGDGFPASLLWQFRVASLATQTALWVGLGLIFAVLSERADAASARRAARSPTANAPGK